MDYLEAHGTGTELGDPIEVHAAAAVYGRGREPGSPLVIGSVKTNIGHLEGAAGIAGLIKAVLSLSHGVIPRHLHFREPNPRIDWDRLPVQVASESALWPRSTDRPARGAVSSFGLSGTNSHIILERYETGRDESTSGAFGLPLAGPARPVDFLPPEAAAGDPPWAESLDARQERLLPLSAKTERGLVELAHRYLSWLEERIGTLQEAVAGRASSGAGDEQPLLAEMAWTAAVGRTHFDHRAGLVFRDVKELRRKLEEVAQRDPGPASRSETKVAFVFTGPGSHWTGMGQSLYETEPVVRAVLDRCDRVMREIRGASLLDVMFGRNEAPGALGDPAWAQPALYALQCALSELWTGVGVRPSAVLGHGEGELAAAWAAGVFDVEAGLRFAAARGEIMAGLSANGSVPRSTVAVFASSSRVSEMVSETNAELGDCSLSLAADNGTHHVVSGSEAAVEALLSRVTAEGVKFERLGAHYGFHGPLSESVLDDLEAAMDGVAVAAPTVTLVSSVTGRPVSSAEVLGGAYWRRQAQEKVAFGDGVASLAAMGVGLVLEIGPDLVLGPIVASAWPGAGPASEVSPKDISVGPPVVLESLRRPSGDQSGAGRSAYPTSGAGTFLEAAAAAFEAGLELSFEALFAGESRRRIALPIYPFQRRRYWIEPKRRKRTEEGHPVLGLRRDSAGGETTFESELLASDPAWLGDHRVFGRVVAPAALQGTLTTAAGHLIGRGGPVAVEGLQLHAPLVLPDEFGARSPANRPVRVQVAVGRSEGHSARRVQVFSREADEESWTLHAEGRVSDGEAGTGGSVDLAALKSRLAAEDVPAFYRSLGAAEVDLGAAFQRVEALWTGPGEAVGEVVLPADLHEEGVLAHPALLDGCFQVLAAVAVGADRRVPETYLPFGWERLWLSGSLPDRLVCHARVREVAAHSEPGTSSPDGALPEVRTADLRLYGTDGLLLGEVTGFTVKRATRAALLAAVGGTAGLVYEVAWRAATDLTGVASVPGPLLLCDGGDGNSPALAAVVDALAERGVQTITGTDADPARLLASVLESADSSRTDLESAEADEGSDVAMPSQARGSSEAVLAGVVFAAPSWLGSVESVATSLEWLLGLVQAILACRLSLPAGLAVVTAEAVAAEPGASVDPAAASLWGFVRSLQLEQPGLGARLVDLAPGSPINPARLQGRISEREAADTAQPESESYRDPASAAVEALLADSAETQVAVRGDRLLVPRLERERLRMPVAGGRFTLAGQGSEDRLAIVAAADRPPGQGELMIAVRACGLNSPEALNQRSGYSGDGGDLRGAVAGVVTAVGAGVEHVRAGDRVFGLVRGGFATSLTTSAALLRRMPPLLGYTHAAAVPVTFATAALAVEMTGLKAGDRMLVRFGTEGVGIAAVQLALATGAEVFAAANRRVTEYLAALGVTRVFDIEDEGFGDSVLEATAGDGVSVVVSCVAGPELVRPSLACLRTGGQFVEIARQDVRNAGAIASARPDVGYHGLALDDWIGADPARVETHLDRLVGQFLDGALTPLPTRPYPLTSVSEAMISMGSGRHIGEVVLTIDHVEIRPEASYLVTGGLGALGLEAAKWIAGQGATHVVLAGRQAPDEAARARLAEIEAQAGCRLLATTVDVADAGQLEALLDQFSTDVPGSGADAAGLSQASDGDRGDLWPPLAGVIHAAGVLDDGPLDGQTRERFRRVLRPKVIGAWLLHQLTLDRELDFYVLYSSLAATVGSPGQSSYAAGNAFLDGLAALRRSAGLAATSVAWGPWSGEGMARSEAAEANISRQGLRPLTADRAHGALMELLSSTRSSAAVFDPDWKKIAESPVESRIPLLSGLLGAATTRQAGVSTLLDRLRKAPQSSREPLLVSFLQEELQEVMQMPSPPDPAVGFFDLGMDSLMAVEFRNRLNRALAGAYETPNTVVFDYPDTAALARHLAENLGLLREAAKPHDPRDPGTEGEDLIAIVGISCRFPGGLDVASFWGQLERGAQAVTDGRPDSEAVPFDDRFRESSQQGSGLGWGAYVEGIDQFDADFFRIAPVEARLMDPQQRMLLETSWQALESAGIDPASLRGTRTGVFAGISSNDYRDLIAASSESASSLYLATGNSGSTAIGRIAFTLGLEGPAIAVDTACSSSLVAVHQAVAGLQRGEADLALACGVNAILSPVATGALTAGGMLAPDGRCKTFDASANGFVRGEGCGVLVLKRLSAAKADGDRIWGVIRGSAVNQDGASAGLTVPNGPAQERVIEEALRRARIEPSEVDYLEAHGTGTELGDPIEVRAAASVYGKGRSADRPLLMGSVKTNIGHLEAAAGIAGLIKVVLSMNFGVIPPHLNFRVPNPGLDWDRLPVRVTSKATEWPASKDRPVRAGVSSFGFSGTNAHVVVEAFRELPGETMAVASPESEVPAGETPVDEPVRSPRMRMLPISGKSGKAVRELASRYLDWLDERFVAPLAVATERGQVDGARVDSALADMAWTASVGRSHFDHRAGLVFREVEDLRGKLAALADREDGPPARTATRVAFLFTGQGSQWAGMGQDLYRCEPTVRNVLDRCDEVMRDIRGVSLLDVMFDRPGAGGDLDDTAWTQPALYSLGCALEELWASTGVRPMAVLGA